MKFQFETGKVYEMPVFFGPAPTPKSPDSSGRYILNKPADVEAVSVQFETDSNKLEALLPERFSSNAPVVSVTACEFCNIGSFAGNTYYLINISTPVHYDGKEEQVDGDLVLAMFENHAEPIIGGRDQLGYSKIYADIPRYVKNKQTIKTSAFSWGFKFLDISIDLDQPAQDVEMMKTLSAKSQGKLNYKYIQGTPYKGVGVGNVGADVCYPTFNPKAWTKPEDYSFTIRQPETSFCSGQVRFNSPEPDDMPTYWHIAKYLADLDIKRYLGAQHSLYNDPCDYSHVYRLK